MIFNLNDLNIKDVITFHESVFKDEFLDKRIFDLKNGEVSGKIYVGTNEEVVLECVFKGTMVIEDSISLENVEYNFDINIEENLDTIEENYPECYKRRQNVLDLKGILWQNIVLEVPISYTKVIDANLSGNGWELISEEKKSEVDPRLKKLEDLLKGDD